MWSSYLFQTTTGRIGPQIQVKDATWSVSLNNTETGKIDISKSELPKVDLDYWLAPWWAGVCLLYDRRPIYAGPIIGRPFESFTTLSVDTGGMRSILARRVVAPELTDWTQLSKSTTAYHGMSLATIAKKVVQLSQQKTGGSLPISFPVPEQTTADDADHQRTYRGFNIQNLFTDDVLTKISNVQHGPDIMFRPRLLNDSQLTFDMWTGSEGQPRIPQTQTPVWDTTPVKGWVADMQMTTTGAYQTYRVYAIGAGTDEGTLIRVASDTGPMQKGYPLLETTYSSGDSEDPNVVQTHANGNLEANNHMLHEISMTVRADGAYPLGMFWPGDLVQLVVKGWVSLPDGVYNARLLNINGTLTNDIKLSLQIER